MLLFYGGRGLEIVVVLVIRLDAICYFSYLGSSIAESIDFILSFSVKSGESNRARDSGDAAVVPPTV